MHACGQPTPEALYPFDARGVAKHLEQIGQIVEQFFIGHHVDSFIGSIAGGMV